MWVFGYGSLVWKPDFPFDSKLIGHVKGFVRRFYQYCKVHRGTSEHTARVVTLIETPKDHDASVWGVAYKLNDGDSENVMRQLDYRETGYERRQSMFYPKDDIDPFEVTVYVGTVDNALYAGEADLDTIAKQVVNASGPNGTNADYVYALAKSMRDIAPNINDEHLFGLEAKVLELNK